MARHKRPVIDMSGSDSDTSEHELSYYAKDKVKLMKEILKIIKPKKIKLMAPDCIKNLDIVEINSMLLEELLGISNKRLLYIFNGEKVDRETSSSESEDEKKCSDIISLDDISDDDEFDLTVASTSQQKISKEPRKKKKSHKSGLTKKNVIKVKKEKGKKIKKSETKKEIVDKHESEKDKLMSVLELLELQARARAIKSQLAIEKDKSKNKTSTEINKKIKHEDDSDSDAVIIDSPHHNEIIITSESDTEAGVSDKKKDNSGELSTTTKQTSDEVEIVEDAVEQNKMDNLNSDSELKLRKEKLLLKLQKIKLSRNKMNLNGSNNTTDNGGNVSTTELEDSSNVTQPVAKDTLNGTLIVTDQLNDTPVIKDTDTAAEIISKICDDPNSSNKTDDSDKGNILTENITTSTKLNNSSAESQAIAKPNLTFCDNDEIVINLDEDEMDDMENNSIDS